jgi:hypothetical protein
MFKGQQEEEGLIITLRRVQVTHDYVPLEL